MIQQATANPISVPLIANGEAIDEKTSPILKTEHGLEVAPMFSVDQSIRAFSQQVGWENIDRARDLFGAGIFGHDAVLVG